MTQIIPNRGQLRTAHERVGRVRVSHPVRASQPQLHRECRFLRLDEGRRCLEEPLQNRPKPHRA